MPAYRIAPIKLVAEAGATEQFIQAGRPADFLERLDAAAEELRLSMLGKARYLGRQVGSRAGLEAEIRRAGGSSSCWTRSSGTRSGRHRSASQVAQRQARPRDPGRDG